MSSENVVSLTGNLTRDPELKFVSSGQALVKFGLAVNRRWQNRQTQEWEEATSFFDVTAWGDLAQNVAQSLAKGSRVMVAGRLEQQSWETDGEKKSKISVIADEVGPSLRWATAEVTKTERSNSSAGNHASSAPSASRPKPAVVASADTDDEFI